VASPRPVSATGPSRAAREQSRPRQPSRTAQALPRWSAGAHRLNGERHLPEPLAYLTRLPVPDISMVFISPWYSAHHHSIVSAPLNFIQPFMVDRPHGL